MLSYPITANPKKPKKNNLIIVSKDKKKYVGLVTRVRTDVVSRYALHNPGYKFEYREKNSKKISLVTADTYNNSFTNPPKKIAQKLRIHAKERRR